MNNICEVKHQWSSEGIQLFNLLFNLLLMYNEHIGKSKHLLNLDTCNAYS